MRSTLKLNKVTLRDLDERDRAKQQLRLTASTSCLTCTCPWDGRYQDDDTARGATPPAADRPSA